MNKSKKGISLIVLVVTIVVIIILVATVLYNITDGKLFGVANESVFKNDLRVIEEEFEMFVQTKATQSVGKFEIESLNAADNGLTYNTKTNDKETNIYDVIPTAKRGYYGEFEIIKGELYYKGDVEQKLIWAKELGIGIIPYEIVDGVLISSNSNLLLLDSTGTVRIPYNVEEIASGVFNNLEGLTRVIIPGSVKRIGRNAFSNNTSLQEVIMEDGVEIINDQAFMNCSNLKSVNLGNTIKELRSASFRGCTKLENITLPNSLTSISGTAFYNCKSLKEIKLPDNITSLGNEVFSYCINLQKINFPQSLNTIGIGVFSRCRNLNYIDTSKSNYFCFENNCLYSNNYSILYSVTGLPTSINLNEKVTTIRYGALTGVTSVKEIYLPKNLVTIETRSLGDHQYNKLVVDEENQNYSSYDNDLYSKNFETLYKCNKSGDIVIKEGVKNIVDGVFLGNNITSIKLPETLESISGYCTIPSSVNYLYLPQNINNISSTSLVLVDRLGVSEKNENFTLLNDKYLLDKSQKSLYWVSKNVEIIDDLPSTIEEIQGRAFSHCTSLSKVVLNNGLKKINSTIFENCNNLKSVEIQSSVVSIDSYAFCLANNLTEIIIHKQRGEISGEPWGAVYGTRVIIYDE